jgi:hypothetical protein
MRKFPDSNYWCIAINIGDWLKICTSFMGYSQIWLNLPRDEASLTASPGLTLTITFNCNSSHFDWNLTLKAFNIHPKHSTHIEGTKIMSPSPLASGTPEPLAVTLHLKFRVHSLNGHYCQGPWMRLFWEWGLYATQDVLGTITL